MYEPFRSMLKNATHKSIVRINSAILQANYIKFYEKDFTFSTVYIYYSSMWN